MYLSRPIIKVEHYLAMILHPKLKSMENLTYISQESKNTLLNELKARAGRVQLDQTSDGSVTTPEEASVPSTSSNTGKCG